MEDRIRSRIETLEAEAFQVQTELQARVNEMVALVEQHNQYVTNASRRIAECQASAGELRALIEGEDRDG